MKDFIKSIKVIVVAVVALVGVAYVQAAWTDATATPPGDNAPAPINVSENAQARVGWLSLGTTAMPQFNLDIRGSVYADYAMFGQSFMFAGENPANGKVLVSKDSDGAATWKLASEVGLGGGLYSSIAQYWGKINSVDVGEVVFGDASAFKKITNGVAKEATGQTSFKTVKNFVTCNADAGWKVLSCGYYRDAGAPDQAATIIQVSGGGGTYYTCGKGQTHYYLTCVK